MTPPYVFLWELIFRLIRCAQTAENTHPNTTSVSSRAGSSSEGGTPVTAGEGSCSPCVEQPGRLLLKPLPGTQEEWSNETSDQPEAVEPMGVCRTLQYGRNLYHEGPSESRGLVCEDGPERRILHSSHRLWPPPIPEVHAGQGEIKTHDSESRGLEEAATTE